MSVKDTIARRFRLPLEPPEPHTYFEHTPDKIVVEDALTHYVTAGDPASPALVLVHGLMTSSYSWRYVIDKLAKHYYVIAPDLPGAGKTEKRPDRAHGLRDMSRFLDQFMSRLECDGAHVVGSSLGGCCALRFALDHPTRVRKLVVIHSPGFPEFRLSLMHALLSIPPVRGLFARWLVRNRYWFVRRQLHYNKPIGSAEEIIEYASMFETLDGARAFARILHEQLDPSELTILRRQLSGGGITAPTLLLWTRDDPLIPPRYGPLYKSLIPHAELEWMSPGVSHFTQCEAPDETVEHIQDFLSG